MSTTHDLGIAERLRGARERIGLSREALAFHSGISWSAIAQAESGRRTNLRPATLSALAKVLGVTIDYLVSGCASSPMLEHRALLYGSQAEFLATAVPFLSEAVDRSEAALAVTTRPRLNDLRRSLGAHAAQVEFADNTSWYRTPTTALDGYREFLTRAGAAGAPWIVILGEPVWTGRSQADVRLWARYESLLNLIFSCSPVTVLCPYDVHELDAQVIEQARATHSHTVEHEALLPSAGFVDPGRYVLEL